MTREKRTYLDRLSMMPGMPQAFRLTMKAALLASRREDGETDEERFYDLKLKIARKVVELWELSTTMEQYLIERWVEARPKLEVLFTGKDVSELPEVNSKLECSETRVVTEEETRKEHLYLDVTWLSYKDLRNAYQAISKCRKMLGLELEDVRRGAPRSMDFIRALSAAVSEERGFSRREMAEMLDFKIYREDIPSGTYPLFHKYLKAGRPILRKLKQLDEYIHELTGIEVDTL